MAMALSEAVVQLSGMPRGSTSPDFMPLNTGVPSANIPRMTPEIVQTIADRLDRGATLLEAHGGYHGDSRQVVMCAIRRRQITELKDLVSRIDPNAFMILQDAHQVLGEGFMRYSDTI